MSYLDELYHYGVPGQKWGVRKKDEPTSIVKKKSHGESGLVKFLKKSSAQRKENAMIKKQQQEEAEKIKEREQKIDSKLTTISELVGSILMPIPEVSGTKGMPGSKFAAKQINKPIHALQSQYTENIKKIVKKIDFLIRG